MRSAEKLPLTLLKPCVTWQKCSTAMKTQIKASSSLQRKMPYVCLILNLIPIKHFFIDKHLVFCSLTHYFFELFLCLREFFGNFEPSKHEKRWSPGLAAILIVIGDLELNLNCLISGIKACSAQKIWLE